MFLLSLLPFFETLSQPRLPLNSGSSFLSLLSSAITDTSHHTCLPKKLSFKMAWAFASKSWT